MLFIDGKWKDHDKVQKKKKNFNKLQYKYKNLAHITF